MHAIVKDLLPSKIIGVILLMVGVNVVHILVLFILPQLYPFAEVTVTLMAYSHWIKNGIFGLAILWMSRAIGVTSIFISILAIVHPAFGSIFYILATLEKKAQP